MTNPMAGKGPMRHSQKVRTATDSVASNDVDNFDRGGMPDEQAPVNPVQVISTFANLGEALKRSGTFREVAEQIAQISEMAESTIMQEAGDWFDATTIKRNMKELGAYSKDFSKLAEEMDGMQQRATALYDDMGNVLTRYFEMTQDGAPEEAPFGGEKADAFDGPGGDATDDEGRHKWDMKDGEEDDSDDVKELSEKGTQGVPEKHQVKIAKQTLKMSDSGAKIMGGMTKDEAREVLKKHGVRIKESAEEVLDESPLGRGIKHGGRVKHKKYGSGTVKNLSGAYITVKWDSPENFPSKLKIPGVASVDRNALRAESAVAPNDYNARRSLRLPKALQRTHGGFTRDDAKNVLKKGKAKSVTEAKKCIYKEIVRLVESGEIAIPRNGKRLNEGDSAKKEAAFRKIVDTSSMGKVEGIRVDLFSAGAVVQVMDALNPSNKAKYLSMPVPAMVSTAFKLAQKK